MAEEEVADSNEEGAGKGGKPWILILLVALIAGGGGAGATWFMVGKSEAAPSPAAAEAAPEAGEADAVPEESFGDRVFALEPFVVNITSEGYPRYLKLKLELELDQASTKEEAEARLAQMRDTIILLLSSKRLTDISEFEGKALLKEDIRNRLNGIIETGKVQSVLFTELVVQ